MSRPKNSKSWEIFANLILRNRIVFLAFVFITTLLLSTQWKNLKFSYSEANLMPKITLLIYPTIILLMFLEKRVIY